MIEYLGVHKAFDRPVLAGVDLTVFDGEILAIIGPSGTGKSVLLKTTCGLLIPDRGEVRIDGASVLRGPRGALARLRHDVGYVFQNAALFDSLNVFENVALGISDQEARRIGTRELVRRVSRALEQVRLDAEAVLPKAPSELSGGMRKRVGLARALVGRPRVLLYDEPVTGLDPVTAAAISRLIVDVASELGTTSLLTTHDIEGALEFCNRLALLAGGRIRLVGTPSDFRKTTDPLARAFVDRGAAAAFAATADAEGAK